MRGEARDGMPAAGLTALAGARWAAFIGGARAGESG